MISLCGKEVVALWQQDKKGNETWEDIEWKSGMIYREGKIWNLREEERESETGFILWKSGSHWAIPRFEVLGFFFDWFCFLRHCRWPNRKLEILSVLSNLRYRQKQNGSQNDSFTLWKYFKTVHRVFWTK